MSKKILSAVLGIIFLTLTLGAAYSFAPRFRENRQDSGYRQESRRQKMHEFKQILKELNLTADQETKIREMRFSAQKETINLKRDLDLKKLDLKAALSADQPDEKTVKERFGQIEAIKTKIQLLRLDQLLKIRTLLTPEQREKFKTIFKAGGKEQLPSMEENEADYIN